MDSQVTPGTLFALPLKSGGYGIILITRAWRLKHQRTGVVYTYGFRNRWDRLPTLCDCVTLTIHDGINFSYANDRLMRNGTYHRIGILPNYSDLLWPIAPAAATRVMPIKEMHTGGFSVVSYGDTDGELFRFNSSCVAPIALEDYFCLPAWTYLGDGAATAAGLDLAINEQHPWQYCAPNSLRYESWSRVMRTILTHKPELRQAATIWTKILNL